MVKAMVKRAKHSKQRQGAAGRVRAIGAFVPDLTKCAFQKYGFSTATILTDWPEIVGGSLAAATRPERLKWPRSPHAYCSLEGHQRGREGATLILRVEPALALDVQYQSSAIKDRINAYFGYYAVQEIRLLQAPIEKAAKQQNRAFTAKKENAFVSGNSSEHTASNNLLSDALARLQRHIIPTSMTTDAHTRYDTQYAAEKNNLSN